MRRVISTITAILVASATIAQTTIHIAPNGSDANSGTVSSPMLTLQAAIKKVVSTTAKDTAFVDVAPGDYYIRSSCRITEANSRPIVVRASDGRARFIGGLRITGWKRSNANTFKVYIPEAIKKGLVFEQLYIKGERATLARTPNKGFYKVRQVTEKVGDSIKYSKNNVLLRISGKELEHLKNVQMGKESKPKVSFHHKWCNSKLYIDSIDKRSHSFTTRCRWLSVFNSIVIGTPYYLYDYANALDTIGEWHMDYKSGYLSYIAHKNENPNDAECFIPTTEKWIEIVGKENGIIENISFKNIEFIVSRFNLPKNGYRQSQAAENTGAAIELSFTRNISFSDCTFANCGEYAIWLKKRCHSSRIERCLIEDTGAGGIRVGLSAYTEGEDITSGNIIDNNILRKGGKEVAEGVAIFIQNSADNKITHNDISEYSYTGISIGWKWGYGNSPAYGNTIAYNHIHHIGNGELSDMGGIYTLGESKGNRIIGNVIHDIKAFEYGGWGIYTDEGTSNTTIMDNLVYHCHDGAFHQHYGKNNKIQNNIFAFGDNCQIQITRAEAHKSFTFRRNIILQERGTTAIGKWFDANMKISRNLYWSYGNELVFCGKKRDEWKKERERNAIFADPLMSAPLEGDFSFKSKKTIKKIKFKPFDYNKAGVYGSEEWRRKAEWAKP